MVNEIISVYLTFSKCLTSLCLRCKCFPRSDTRQQWTNIKYKSRQGNKVFTRYEAVDEVGMEQRAHVFLVFSLSCAYRVECCNPDFHPLWIAEHNTKGHTRQFRDMVKPNCVVEGRSSKRPCSYCGTRNFSD